MAQKSVHHKILPVLESYLERKDIEFWVKPEKNRTPTLPTTVDNKVNVRELVKELQREPGGAGVILDSHQQHFFNKEELANPVNAMAVVQGVGLIGSRALSDADTELVRGQIARLKQVSKVENEAMVELAAENTRLRAEVARLRAERRFIQETGLVLRRGEIIS